MYKSRMAPSFTIEALAEDLKSLHGTACLGRKRSLEAYILPARSREI